MVDNEYIFFGVGSTNRQMILSSLPKDEFKQQVELRAPQQGRSRTKLKSLMLVIFEISQGVEEVFESDNLFQILSSTDIVNSKSNLLSKLQRVRNESVDSSLSKVRSVIEYCLGLDFE